VKAVYASVFYRESKAYLTATQNLIDQEKMAIVLQEVVGQGYSDVPGGAPRYFYPTLSGVARSLNFYPIGDEQAEDGICQLAFGLGKYIVDGGLALRVSPQHPHHILQLSTTDFALRETQRFFYALDLGNLSTQFQTDDAFNLKKINVKEAEAHGSLRFVASTYDPYDAVVRDGIYPGGRKLVTFANILQHGVFPLAETVSNLLRIGREEMGRPVEIEFAMDIRDEGAHFYLLQIRPIVAAGESIDEDLTAIRPENTVIYCQNSLGNGIISEVSDILYVKTDGYTASNNPAIAREVEKVNRQLMDEGRGYILCGPGRWGSSDSWLGIPVKWPHIAGARVIVELGLENYRVDPSQGTHFFQNLTSFGVGYFTINTYTEEGHFDQQWLDDRPAVLETQFLRLVRCEHPLTIKIDGRRGIGVIMEENQ
jgi:hypothetical protein